MSELKPFYNSNVICPICEKEIQVTKVRSKFIKLIKQDEDFALITRHVTRFYEAWFAAIVAMQPTVMYLIMLP